VIAGIFLCLAQGCRTEGWFRGDEPENLLWPLGDGWTPSKIRQTYGQAEVTGTVHLHAGLDLVPEDKDRSVWSLEEGTVVRVYLGGVGDQKRSGLVVASKPVPGRAFQYMHLEPNSIQLHVGDPVVVDQYLGEVRAEDDETEYPEHLHLSRLGGRYEDETIPWGEVENLSIRNPLVLIDHTRHLDMTPPEIVVDETKLFRKNESHGDPQRVRAIAVMAPVMLDVLVQVQDRSASSVGLAPYSLELAISGGGHRESFGLLLDGPLPMTSDVLYDASSTAGACTYVLTNGSSASDAMDKLHAWCASKGQYTLELTAKDAAGLSTPKTLTIVIP